MILPDILIIIGLSIVGSGIIWLHIEVIIWRQIRKKSADKDLPLFKEMTVLAFISGIIEISLYSFFFVVEAKEFILLWIGIKTALRWNRNRKEEDKPDNYVQRGTYYSFLIGTALSIVFSYSIASMVNHEMLMF